MQHLKAAPRQNFGQKQLHINPSSLGDADFECMEEENRVTNNFYRI